MPSVSDKLKEVSKKVVLGAALTLATVAGQAQENHQQDSFGTENTVVINKDKENFLKIAKQFKSMDDLKIENYSWTNDDDKDCTKTVYGSRYASVIEDNIGGEEYVTLFAEDCNMVLNKNSGKILNHTEEKELSSKEVSSKLKHFSWNSGLEGHKEITYALALANMQKAQQSQMDR